MLVNVDVVPNARTEGEHKAIRFAQGEGCASQLPFAQELRQNL